MKIDRHTTNAEFAPFAAIVSHDDMMRVREAAVRDMFGEAGFYGMTVGQLTDIISGDPRPLLQSGGRTVFDTCRVEAFRQWIDEFSSALRRMSLPQTAESIALSAGTMQADFVESLYIFCRSYFGLGSFEACDRLKVSEYMIARKDDYNRAVVERNVSTRMKGGKR